MRTTTAYDRKRAATIVQRTAAQSAVLLTAGFVAGMTVGLIGGLA
jgi:hypothetical protein